MTRWTPGKRAARACAPPPVAGGRRMGALREGAGAVPSPGTSARPGPAGVRGSWVRDALAGGSGSSLRLLAARRSLRCAPDLGSGPRRRPRRARGRAAIAPSPKRTRSAGAARTGGPPPVTEAVHLSHKRLMLAIPPGPAGPDFTALMSPHESATACRLCHRGPAADGHPPPAPRTRAEARATWSCAGPLCRECGLVAWRRMTLDTALLGWWGLPSVVVTPVDPRAQLDRPGEAAPHPRGPGGRRSSRSTWAQPASDTV